MTSKLAMLGVTIVGWKQRDLAMERLAARFGPRLFMSSGPAIMALGLGWLARIPIRLTSLGVSTWHHT